MSAQHVIGCAPEPGGSLTVHISRGWSPGCGPWRFGVFGHVLHGQSPADLVECARGAGLDVEANGGTLTLTLPE